MAQYPKKPKYGKILLHHNGIYEKNLMHNLKKIYLMMSDRLHDAVNDFSHPRSEDLSKVNQKSTHHWKFKTIILGNKSVKTELYTRRLWEQTEKFEYPTYLAMLQSFAKTKTFRNLKHLPRKLTWHLIKKKKKSLSWIKPPLMHWMKIKTET